MYKIKGKVIILIILSIYLCSSIGVLYSINQGNNQINEETKYYEATVNDIEFVNTGKDVYVEIETKEYGAKLYISVNICKNIEMKDIQSIEQGEKIQFRIENRKSELLNEVEFVDIVSLRTESADIFSLENYNKYMRNASYPARTIMMIEIIIFIIVIAMILLQIAKQKNINNN